MSNFFKSIQNTTRLMNPFKDFGLDEIISEIRFDPLTGQTGRVFDLPFKAEITDWSKIVQRSREMFCPFCAGALEKSTPLFPENLIPEGRIRVGQATVIPNLVPFDKYAGVTVMTEEHYVAMEDWTPEILKDAFAASLEFFRKVAEQDPGVNFFSINWNYMPPAGSSIVHPHLQPNCGDVPTNEHRLQLAGCRAYRENHGGDFWDDLLRAEREAGQRYIGEMGPTAWLLNYVPQGFLPDVWCIFTEHGSLLEMGEDHLTPFLGGLSRTLDYFNRIHVSSFNVSLFSVREDTHFRVNAKVCPRLLPRPIGNSDIAYLQMIHKEPFCVKFPESLCEEIKGIFRT